MTTAPYYARWVKLAQTLEDARRQAIALGSVRSVNPNKDPSVEQFGGTEALEFDALIDDIRAALDFDDDLARGERPRLRYHEGELYSYDPRARGGKVRAAGKGRIDAGDLARFGADAVIKGQRERLRRHRQHLIEREGAVGGPDRESRARIAAVDEEIAGLAAAVAKLTR